jgi:magnesium chelatase subunit D
VRRDDFRVRRLVERRGTTTIFAVDASGSAALHRLAETKGAVELMLAESYARRDRVSVVAFRGAGAQVLLPPTRALARAKRALGALAGGGGTPLAAGIDAACGLALAARREGSRAVVVFLTDARANVARDGGGGRARAEADAVDAARRLRASGCAALLVDTSPRGEPFARRLALELGGRYEPLPYPESHAVSGLARALAAAPTGERRG